jgi:hypothetical protein
MMETIVLKTTSSEDYNVDIGLKEKKKAKSEVNLVKIDVKVALE